MQASRPSFLQPTQHNKTQQSGQGVASQASYSVVVTPAPDTAQPAPPPQPEGRVHFTYINVFSTVFHCVTHLQVPS